MVSKRNSSIITAYSALFTVAFGIVAQDLWTQREAPSVPSAAQQMQAAVLAATVTKPSVPASARGDIATR